MARTARKETEVDHTRHEILRAAARAAARKGFEALTIRDIAKEAGYTVGTLYNYFDGKEAIIQGLIQQLTDVILRSLHEPLPAGLTFRQKVELLALRQLTMAEEWRDGVMSILAMMWGSATLPLEAMQSSKLRDGFVKWVRANAQRVDLGGKDPIEVALFYFGVLQSVVLAESRKKSKAPLVDLLPRIMDLLFHGLGPAK
jgi:AcrR family transcriptional regulator